jgi:hypothetical protein
MRSLKKIAYILLNYWNSINYNFLLLKRIFKNKIKIQHPVPNLKWYYDICIITNVTCLYDTMPLKFDIAGFLTCVLKGCFHKHNEMAFGIKTLD